MMGLIDSTEAGLIPHEVVAACKLGHILSFTTPEWVEPLSIRSISCSTHLDSVDVISEGQMCKGLHSADLHKKNTQ